MSPLGFASPSLRRKLRARGTAWKRRAAALSSCMRSGVARQPQPARRRPRHRRRLLRSHRRRLRALPRQQFDRALSSPEPTAAGRAISPPTPPATSPALSLWLGLAIVARSPVARSVPSRLQEQSLTAPDYRRLARQRAVQRAKRSSAFHTIRPKTPDQSYALASTPARS